ncbi:hypothetical protein NPIL_176471 [Nephila pilipes]|uniref:Uncharacterized protein n=1 Tax=Nephila pilipes TaxID=299642 RepID=A0A8X6PMS7_NEPPI|nr:hypothetical protein NPIL_176471 [Nephila pilipes]
MYCQVLVLDSDSDMQRRIWKKSSHNKLKEYCLKTVTYRTYSTTYLATKANRQLVYKDTRFPLKENVILRECHVDDLFSQTNSLLPDSNYDKNGFYYLNMVDSSSGSGHLMN